MHCRDQKAFDRVNHELSIDVVSKGRIPELEQRLIISLYWNQYAVVRIKGGIGRRICIRKGLRQGCVSDFTYFVQLVQ